MIRIEIIKVKNETRGINKKRRSWIKGDFQIKTRYKENRNNDDNNCNKK